jgi:hypothetical protein
MAKTMYIAYTYDSSMMHIFRTVSTIFKRKEKSTPQRGFSVAEVLTAIVLATLVIVVMASSIEIVVSLNSKASRRADAGALAFKKVQDYINVDFSSVPIGSTANDYEIEDFSSEAEAAGLQNADAKVYIEPASAISGAITNTESFTVAVSADTAFAAGARFSTARFHVSDGGWRNPTRIRDNNYSNYTHNPDSTNVASPSIDLNEPRNVDTIRVNYYYCGYGLTNFAIQAKNSSPTSNSGWVTISSGLSSGGIPCSVGSNPIDYDVSSNTTAYRYWRLFIVSSESSSMTAISELEAFSSGTPGDTVEQRSASASFNAGGLDFSSSNLELTDAGSAGQQSVGIKFNNVGVPKSAMLTSAYISFTPVSSSSLPIQLRARGVAVDSAGLWNGVFAVDKAIDNDNSDGLVGTTSLINWDVPAWIAGGANTNTRMDVTSIVQEIINRAGWVSGNNIAFGITYVSGLGVRQATRSPAPQLVLQWDESTEVLLPGGYVDVNGDGDVDNPTLLKVVSVIEFDHFGSRQRVEYVTYMRQYGVGD